MILLVTYDLKGPAGSYAELFDVLKSHRSWWHYIPSTWLIDTDDSDADMFFRKISDLIGERDRLLVVEVVDGYAGFLPDKAWRWLANRGLHP